MPLSYRGLREIVTRSGNTRFKSTLRLVSNEGSDMGGMKGPMGRTMDKL